MTRDQLLAIAKRELEHHDFSTFREPVPGSPTGAVTRPGCPSCMLHLNTVPQFMQHLSDDVLPGIVDLILTGGRGL